VQEWLSRTETRRHLLDERSTLSLAATLGADPARGAAGAALPPGWHWIMFSHFLPEAELLPDGLPRGGDFLPPLPGMVRMWAGTTLEWRRPLIVGETYERRSTVAALKEKQGRSGRLVFATVLHEIGDSRGTCMTERYEVVFREPPVRGAAAPFPAPPDATWCEQTVPEALLLFRYSALTFNPHRIHYDQAYATEVEGYPGLVVHGPLTATLLLEFVRRQAPVGLTRCVLRAASPLFADRPVTLAGRPEADGCLVWAADDAGSLAMSAAIRFAN
jgi:3-methylfumaryl-CoA hydratase